MITNVHTMELKGFYREREKEREKERAVEEGKVPRAPPAHVFLPYVWLSSFLSMLQKVDL